MILTCRSTVFVTSDRAEQRGQAEPPTRAFWQHKITRGGTGYRRRYPTEKPMQLVSHLLATVFIAAILWWNGCTAGWVVLGTSAVICIFGATHFAEVSIKRFANRTAVRSNWSDGTYVPVAMGIYLSYQFTYPNSGLLPRICVFGLGMLLGRVTAQLAFGTRLVNDDNVIHTDG